MKIFITGASGYIGNSVARAFRENGHRVYGLIRSEKWLQKLHEAEIVPVLGNLDNPTPFYQSLIESDVLIQCALESSVEGVKRDAEMIDAFLNAANESEFPKTIIYTSGVWLYGNTYRHVADETTPLDPISLSKWRERHEKKILEGANSKVRIIVMRPGCVFGGAGSLTSLLFDSIARGEISVIEGGENRWAMIHKDDLARAYVMAAEKEVATNIFNVVDNSRNTIREMAEAIAMHVFGEKKIRSLSLTEAEKEYGALTEGLVVNQQVCNQKAKRLLDWHPKHISFIDDIGCMYNAWKASQ